MKNKTHEHLMDNFAIIINNTDTEISDNNRRFSWVQLDPITEKRLIMGHSLRPRSRSFMCQRGSGDCEVYINCKADAIDSVAVALPVNNVIPRDRILGNLARSYFIYNPVEHIPVYLSLRQKHLSHWPYVFFLPRNPTISEPITPGVLGAVITTLRTEDCHRPRKPRQKKKPLQQRQHQHQHSALQFVSLVLYGRVVDETITLYLLGIH